MGPKPRLVGVELYFDDLNRAQAFYATALGLTLADAAAGHHAKFDTPSGFVCLEQRGTETYPSADKAVLFIDVSDLRRKLDTLGPQHVVRYEPTAHPPWAAVHDPEGHTVVLIQGPAA